MTLDEIRQKKRQYGYTNEQMATLSGLPLSTVQKVLGGTTKSPRRQTLAALAAVFPKETPVSYREDVTALPSGIAEPPAAYGARRTPRWPRQGEYTLEDYLALPDDVRVELIDGVFYDMGAPTTVHQEVVGEVFFLLKSFIRSHGGSCRPFISPVDVQLDADDGTIVQPDVLLLCDPSKRTYERIVGAPDLVMEVLSPSTRSKDILIKKKNTPWQASANTGSWTLSRSASPPICFHRFPRRGRNRTRPFPTARRSPFTATPLRRPSRWRSSAGNAPSASGRLRNSMG